MFSNNPDEKSQQHRLVALVQQMLNRHNALSATGDMAFEENRSTFS